MALPQQTSILDSEPYYQSIVNLITSGETNTSVVRQLEYVYDLATTTDSIRRFRQRHGLNIPGTERVYTRINGDEAEATCEVTTQDILDDPDTMLRQRGLDPEEWYIDAVTVNQWDGLQKGGINKTKLYQTKFTAKRKRPELVLQPVRSDGWCRTQGRRPSDDGRPQLVVVCGDQQAPFQDPALHEAFLAWLSHFQPARGVINGDLGDFPDISRHPKDPENIAYANECLQGSYDILRDYVTCSPQTWWEYLPGNHDERIRQYTLNHAPLLHDLRRVETEDSGSVCVNGLAHLLRLDELDIQFIEPYGTYEDTQVELSKNLAVRHGWIVRQGSGTSALKTLEQTGYSIIIGHTHRQSVVYHTKHDIDRQPSTLTAVETGCMCRIDSQRDLERDPLNRRFPAYTVLPDWQQGFATATIWPDGKFRVDLATFVNGVLLYRDWRY